jgi:hypothetical protein
MAATPHPVDLPVAEMANRVADPEDPLTVRELAQERLRRIEALHEYVRAFLPLTPDLPRAQVDGVRTEFEPFAAV